MDELQKYIARQEQIQYQAEARVDLANRIRQNIWDMKKPSDRAVRRRMSTCTSTATDYGALSCEGADRVALKLEMVEGEIRRQYRGEVVNESVEETKILSRKLEAREMGEEEYLNLASLNVEQVAELITTEVESLMASVPF